MSATPTTWVSRPACATDAMIEAGARALQVQYPYMTNRVASNLATAVINAALAVSPKPEAVSAWLPIGPDAKTGASVLLWIPGSNEIIIAKWLPNSPGFPWYAQGGTCFREESFTLYRPIPEPPATGDANG